MYWGRGTFANSVDPDHTAPKEQSDQGLHCLPYHQLILGTPQDCKIFILISLILLKLSHESQYSAHCGIPNLVHKNYC